MARQKSDLEIEVENRMAGWVAIGRQEEPMEWEAWTHWRQQNCGSKAQPESLTVPTPFPPITINAARDYLETIRKARLSMGWKRGADRVSNNPSAWMGGRAA